MNLPAAPAEGLAKLVDDLGDYLLASPAPSGPVQEAWRSDLLRRIDIALAQHTLAAPAEGLHHPQGGTQTAMTCWCGQTWPCPSALAGLDYDECSGRHRGTRLPPRQPAAPAEGENR